MKFIRYFQTDNVNHNRVMVNFINKTRAQPNNLIFESLSRKFAQISGNLLSEQQLGPTYLCKELKTVGSFALRACSKRMTTCFINYCGNDHRKFIKRHSK